jgi:hypothetical protein
MRPVDSELPPMRPSSQFEFETPGLINRSFFQDLNTIRTTLHLDRSEEEAIEFFRKDFDESLKNAWTISVDWWFHSINQVETTNKFYALKKKEFI